MIVQEKNEGAKISYEVIGTRITLNDEMMLNLTKYEREADVHLDICFDPYGSLVIGAVTGSRYAAEIDIPARRFKESTITTGEDEEGQPLVTTINEHLPLNMEEVTLTLWSVEQEDSIDG